MILSHFRPLLNTNYGCNSFPCYEKRFLTQKLMRFSVENELIFNRLLHHETIVDFLALMEKYIK